MRGLRICVAIVTRGRPTIAAACLERLARQTRQPDMVVVSAVGPEDVAGAARTRLGAGAAFVFGPPGIAAQRNRALALSGTADVVLFLDDDFIAFDDSISGVAALFAARPKIAGATGEVIADGARGAPLCAETAEALVAAAPRPRAGRAASETPVIGLYGCNMAIRLRAATGLLFDEGLPLYGWQEDLDFGARLARRGDVIRTNAFGGAHLGVKSGRHPQRGLGYAQIANPVRLARHSAAPPLYLARLAVSNIAANLIGAALGDEWTDRKGRLAGNIAALSDMARGRLDPERVRNL